LTNENFFLYIQEKEFPQEWSYKDA
jgi:hypothetical protein